MILRAVDAATQVVEQIRAHRYRWTDEAQLQEGVTEALLAAGLPVVREVRLSARDRIDAVVDRIGVEMKVSAPGRTTPVDRVLAQLVRYAASGQFDALVLVTTSPRHAILPDTVAGLPLHVVVLGGLG